MTNMEGTPTPPAPPGPETGDVPNLRRRATNRWIAGVCSGLADYFGLHPAVYRVLFVALAFAGGTGILLYIAAALVMPVQGHDESAASSFLRANRNRPWLVIGLALLALVLIAVLTGPGDDGGFGLFVLALLAAAVALVWSRAARRDRRRADATGRRSVVWRTGSIVALVAVLTTAVAGVAVAAHPKGGFGERVERPTTAAQLDSHYRLGVGQLELDLSDLELPLGETRVRAEVSFGELDVTLPPGVAASVTADVKWGEADVLGSRSEGDDAHERFVDSGFEDAPRRLVVETKVRAGEISVRR